MADPTRVVVESVPQHARGNRVQTKPVSPETILGYLRKTEDTLRELGIEIPSEQTWVRHGENELSWEIHLDRSRRYALRIVLKRKTGMVEVIGEQYDKQGMENKGMDWRLDGDTNVLSQIRTSWEGRDEAYFQEVVLGAWLPTLANHFKQP